MSVPSSKQLEKVVSRTENSPAINSFYAHEWQPGEKTPFIQPIETEEHLVLSLVKPREDLYGVELRHAQILLHRLRSRGSVWQHMPVVTAPRRLRQEDCGLRLAWDT